VLAEVGFERLALENISLGNSDVQFGSGIGKLGQDVNGDRNGLEAMRLM
jgi:hypothetical protein